MAHPAFCGVPEWLLGWLVTELVLVHDQHLGPVEAHLHETTTHAAPAPSP